MTESITLLAIVAPAILLLGVLYWTDRIRRREALFRWMAEHGFKLLSFHQPRLTELSGFPLAVSKAQQVFRVEVEDSRGQYRTGWVRLGNARRGLGSRTAQVRWDTGVGA